MVPVLPEVPAAGVLAVISLRRQVGPQTLVAAEAAQVPLVTNTAVVAPAW
jgi:hypothetical protein